MVHPSLSLHARHSSSSTNQGCIKISRTNIGKNIRTSATFWTVAKLSLPDVNTSSPDDGLRDSLDIYFYWINTLQASTLSPTASIDKVGCVSSSIGEHAEQGEIEQVRRTGVPKVTLKPETAAVQRTQRRKYQTEPFWKLARLRPTISRIKES